MNILKQLISSSVPQLSPNEVQQKLSERPLLLDVRQHHEFAGDHIAGSTLIPLHELDRRRNELSHDRQIICICRSGSRSKLAANKLLAAGYQAYNLRGGLVAWKMARLPVQHGDHHR